MEGEGTDLGSAADAARQQMKDLSDVRMSPYLIARVASSASQHLHANMLHGVPGGTGSHALPPPCLMRSWVKWKWVTWEDVLHTSGFLPFLAPF